MTPKTTTHDSKKAPTVYERADTFIRGCTNRTKPCTYRRTYEGDEIDEILNDEGAPDPDKVDSRCPLCNHPVDEHLYTEDGDEL